MASIPSNDYSTVGPGEFLSPSDLSRHVHQCRTELLLPHVCCQYPDPLFEFCRSILDDIHAIHLPQFTPGTVAQALPLQTSKETRCSYSGENDPYLIVKWNLKRKISIFSPDHFSFIPLTLFSGRWRQVVMNHRQMDTTSSRASLLSGVETANHFALKSTRSYSPGLIRYLWVLPFLYGSVNVNPTHQYSFGKTKQRRDGDKRKSLL